VHQRQQERSKFTAFIDQLSLTHRAAGFSYPIANDEEPPQILMASSLRNKCTYFRHKTYTQTNRGCEIERERASANVHEKMRRRLYNAIIQLRILQLFKSKINEYGPLFVIG